jgi:type IV secretory pathway VirB10-like protein
MGDQYDETEYPGEGEADAPEQRAAGPEEEERYEGTPEELTGFAKSGPAWFDRKKVMMTLAAVFAAIVITGLVFSTMKQSKKTEQGAGGGLAARTPRDFLDRELDRSRRNGTEGPEEEGAETDASGLPGAVAVTLNETPAGRARNESRSGETPQTPRETEGRETEGGGGGVPARDFSAQSALVPHVEGKLFIQAPAQAQAPADPSQYAYAPYAPGGVMPYNSAQQPAYPAALFQGQAQDTRDGSRSLYSAETGGQASGAFLPDDLLWIGTMIPAVLETSVNTDLPGNVIARVSQNVYDSRTGTKLLVPQGTILVAMYNSSVSYAQSRVQIVWNTLIRPDGYQLDLGGMNGVDGKGMAGLKAEYRENWFEYLKAAGLITMFSVANARMAEEAAKYGSADTAAGVTQSNADFMSQTGSGIVGRAMNIQPTLILHNGEKINVMLNKNLYLPPLDNYPVTQKYVR